LKIVIVNLVVSSICCAAFCGMLLALLVANAAEVQGANPNLAFAGFVVGIVLGFAFASGKATLRFLGAVFGAIAGLQFFRCFPCDGSHVSMPILGASVLGCAGWFVQAMTPQDRGKKKPMHKG
jgi:hypothetical protein